MKIGLPHTLSKHCSSTNLIVGTKNKEMREHTELFIILLEALVPSHHPFCSPPETHTGLQPTFIPYILCSAATSEFTQKINCHSNISQRYLQFSKMTLVDANNLSNEQDFKSQQSQLSPPTGAEQKEIIRNPW